MGPTWFGLELKFLEREIIREDFMAKFFDNFKKAIGIEDQYYDDYEDEEVETREEAEDFNTEYQTKDESISFEKPAAKRRNIVSLQPSSIEKPKIKIHEPITFDDGPKIVDDILARRVVVLNLEMLEVEKKKQIFDFVSGAIYALSGTIQKVTKDIFVIAPKDVEIDGKLKEEIQAKGFYQL